jgi:hypothetical protein
MSLSTLIRDANYSDDGLLGARYALRWRVT